MKSFLALGVIVWVVIAVWLVRLGMGLDHLSTDQIAVMIICGPVGGLAGWYFISRHAKELAAERKGDLTTRPPV
jgi:hypothetical protein